VTNKNGLPIDKDGHVIDASNPLALPLFGDTNGNGDYFDDSFLRDTRLKPRGHPESELQTDRYSIVIPAEIRGPVAVTAAVYYQSIEAAVAEKFLGNLADTNNNLVLEPCVLGGLCDGRTPTTEPPVVEGAPPVPMVVRNFLVLIKGAPADSSPPEVGTYPAPGATKVPPDAVIKVFFPKPVRALGRRDFVLTDSRGRQIAVHPDQIGAGTWGVFPDQVLLQPGETYSARLKAGVCDLFHNCIRHDVAWKFTVAKEAAQATGDTSIPVGFTIPTQNGKHKALMSSVKPWR
jgi:Bacterial Ig-like domain